MNDSILLKKIVSLIEDLMGEYPFPIILTTALKQDLDITGDDAVEFIIDYSSHFNVDVSGFKATDYFDGEGMDILQFFNKNKKKELTIGDLVAGIKAGRLDEEVINASKEIESI